MGSPGGAGRRLLLDPNDLWDAVLGMLAVRLLGSGHREAVEMGQAALETYEHMGAEAMAAVARRELQGGDGGSQAGAPPAARAAGAPTGAGEGIRT
jgi:hypothetical protein